MRWRPTTGCSTGRSATKPRPTPPSSNAAHVTKIDLVNNRLIPNAMEPRAAIGSYDTGSEHYTLYTTSQNPHVARLVISAFHGLAPEHKLRVIAPDVGGGFGSKIFIYAEEVVCVWASKHIGGRPIKWTAERTESFLADAHGRDHVTHAELATDAERQDHRLQGPHQGGDGRLSLDLRLLRADLSLCHAAVGPVQHPGDLRRSGCDLHQHRTGRRLSRRRPPGGHLCGRAHRGNRGARTEDGSGGIPPEELRHLLPAPDAGDHVLRRGRLCRGARQGAGDRRLQELRRAARRLRPRRASCAASASRPISRPAASPRRRRSVRWVPVWVCGSRRKCA